MTIGHDWSPEMRDEEAIADKWEYDRGLDTPGARRLEAEATARMKRSDEHDRALKGGGGE